MLNRNPMYPRGWNAEFASEVAHFRQSVPGTGFQVNPDWSTSPRDAANVKLNEKATIRRDAPFGRRIVNWIGTIVFAFDPMVPAIIFTRFVQSTLRKCFHGTTFAGASRVNSYWALMVPCQTANPAVEELTDSS